MIPNICREYKKHAKYETRRERERKAADMGSEQKGRAPTEFCWLAIALRRKNENARVIVLLHSIRVYFCVWSVCGVVLKKKKTKEKRSRRRPCRHSETTISYDYCYCSLQFLLLTFTLG
jgi:hypothetical protein